MISLTNHDSSEGEQGLVVMKFTQIHLQILPYGSKHCLRRYLTLYIISKLYPKHFLRRYLDP